jgi:hypothetical protein
MDLHTAGIGKALYDLAIGGRGARLSAVKERAAKARPAAALARSRRLSDE